MTLTEKLELSSGALEELLKDGMTLTELVTFVMTLAGIVAEYSAGAPFETHKVQVMEAWDWAEGKWGLVARVNHKFNLPFVPEEEEAEMLEALAEKVVVPVVATVMSLKTLAK